MDSVRRLGGLTAALFGSWSVCIFSLPPSDAGFRWPSAHGFAVIRAVVAGSALSPAGGRCSRCRNPLPASRSRICRLVHRPASSHPWRLSSLASISGDQERPSTDDLIAEAVESGTPSSSSADGPATPSRSPSGPGSSSSGSLVQIVNCSSRSRHAPRQSVRPDGNSPRSRKSRPARRQRQVVADVVIQLPPAPPRSQALAADTVNAAVSLSAFLSSGAVRMTACQTSQFVGLNARASPPAIATLVARRAGHVDHDIAFGILVQAHEEAAFAVFAHVDAERARTSIRRCSSVVTLAVSILRLGQPLLTLRAHAGSSRWCLPPGR